MVAARRRQIVFGRSTRIACRLPHSHLIDQRPQGSAPTVSARPLDP